MSIYMIMRAWLIKKIDSTGELFFGKGLKVYTISLLRGSL